MPYGAGAGRRLQEPLHGTSRAVPRTPPRSRMEGLGMPDVQLVWQLREG